jgi:hypothetical protein
LPAIAATPSPASGFPTAVIYLIAALVAAVIAGGVALGARRRREA